MSGSGTKRVLHRAGFARNLGCTFVSGNGRVWEAMPIGARPSAAGISGRRGDWWSRMGDAEEGGK